MEITEDVGTHITKKGEVEDARRRLHNGFRDLLLYHVADELGTGTIDDSDSFPQEVPDGRSQEHRFRSSHKHVSHERRHHAHHTIPIHLLHLEN